MSDEEKWQMLIRHEKLGEVLLKRRLLTLAQLDELIKAQAKSGKPLGEVVVSKGLLSREQVTQAVEWQQRSDRVESEAVSELKNKRKNP